ncbi:acyl-ACP--UDP-N-acetylglucosamine O-acyltransferase [Ideonella sp. DXS29W]|uniref:Acyl-ACP--UDP-N-acetylglucosamine O-acyltransferase n=1 Tax=Ideonella lacteola TaxID=2984193 RepID=A0ABU9BL43_9BURK
MIHPTAVISGNVQIDPTAEIGPWCVIEGDITIGPRTRLMNGVSLQGRVTVGADNVFGAHAVIGGMPQDQVFKPEDDTEVVIGDRNHIYEFVTIHRGTRRRDGRTVLGDDNFVMAYVHLAHDVVLGHHTRITSYTGIAGLCTIGDHAVIAGMVGMQQYIRVGAYAFISGMSAVTQDVLPYSIAYGTEGPIHLRGANLIGLKRHGFSRDDMDTARQVLARLQGTERPFAEVLSGIEADFDPNHAIVRHVLEFARTPSPHGVLR